MPEGPAGEAEGTGVGDPLDRAARAACRRLRLAAPEALRRGSNALYASGDVVLRVGVPDAIAASAAGLSTLLAAHGIGVPRVVDVSRDAESGVAVMVVERLGHDGSIDWEAVGRQVRRVHSLDPSHVAEVHPLPSCSGFAHWRFRERFDEVSSLLGDSERRALGSAVDGLADWASAAEGAPQVVCHGDVHPGNVIAAGGRSVLLDWDMICAAPPAWDHSALLTWETRWGGEPGTYAAFASGYGADLRGEPLAGLLATGRLLAATLMRVRAGRTDVSAAEEARRRLRYWTGDPHAPQWRAV